ncbi:MAG: hypothetical protein IPK79_09035 [Vampirovibrionales bacterium]|nr:hypothetical protein [Vampirovibrionales bacterium]
MTGILTRFRVRLLLAFALIVGALAGLSPAGWCDLDTIYLANGQRLQGKVLQITGDFVEYRTATGAVGLVRRLEMASRMDRIETRTDRRYEGEIKNLGSFIAEIHSPLIGQREVWRLFIKKMTLGLSPQDADPAADSDLLPQAPARIFPTLGRPDAD